MFSVRVQLVHGPNLYYTLDCKRKGVYILWLIKDAKAYSNSAILVSSYRSVRKRSAVISAPCAYSKAVKLSGNSLGRHIFDPDQHISAFK